ncbi:hypothetical protein RWA02_17290 [Sinorhizobium meliloti]|uniref:hypothetical protein n=1 Tax=Rhizobium meliloti TaxID=382 RepID=UPI0013E3F87B|nr:hypothetical protein [Sinorhizobium meliloti]MDW9363591.1 hypothetical protein [Sinorhizobium meliloti]
MRYIFLSAALFTAGNAEAACNESLLTVKEWSVNVKADEAEVAVTLASSLTKPARMIDASVVFSDALGQRIGQIPADFDEKLAIGATYTTGGSYAGTKLDRAAKLDRHDVNVTACLRGVVYEDGTKEEFK